MVSPFPTLARWPALFFLLAALLQGCSLLPQSNAQDASAPADAAAPGAAPAAFTLDVRAPEAVRNLLERHLELQRFRHLPDLQANELQRLLGAAEANARELLAAQGYFAPAIALEARETPDATAPRAVLLSVDPGPQTQVASADIRFTGSVVPPAIDTPASPPRASESGLRQLQRVQRNWSLAPGQSFTQPAWSNAKSDGLRQLQVRRYPTARIAKSRAEVDADSHQAALSVTYDPGPAYRFGPLQIQGSERYAPDGARRIARLPTGTVYSETQLLDAQQRLAASGYYDAVFLALDTAEGTDPQAAPVVAQVREARLQKIVFGVGASTDSGPHLSLDHIHNRLPGIGWRAVSKLSLDRKTKLLGTEWADLPDEAGWRWLGGGQVQREATGDYQVNSGRLRGGRSKSSARIDRSYFLQYDYANSQGLDATPSSSAISANYAWTGRYFNSTTAPTRGYGLALEMGAGSTLGQVRDPFMRTLLRWQWFVAVGRVQADDGSTRRSRLALRTEAGAVLARPAAPVPVTQMFLTGGDTTVRGYGYRAIGARTGNGQLFGGRYLGVASAEWQRPMVREGRLTDWENTFFIDAGAVADHARDLDPRVGVGTGVRWRSPVGPLQADLAYGLRAHRLRLHLRLGFNF